ncbi:hypothetical protein HER32_14530 [Hymenobacter sp. BT18]|uniref:hypothetical protein n=1 Tax=Hymenobacter sp. BT18 TaxID=2835648 RepID=UPI00143EDCA9|nr:hypothetical protein [Hymenobacter sp. BT18]QIX62328.1 hypothetical protein HER32_14530 [Hymenobacter sp. BT18]
MACESAPPATATSSPAVARLPHPAAKVADSATAGSASPKPAPDYTGTYAVLDTAICPLSITITRHGSTYSFSCTNGLTTSGRVEISQEADGTYFTFIGLKGQEPAEDISAAWEDNTLRIQNYGNSMNDYTRFGNCDAKYLDLRRQ